MEVQWNTLHTRLIQPPTQVKFLPISIDIPISVTSRSPPEVKLHTPDAWANVLDPIFRILVTRKGGSLKLNVTDGGHISLLFLLISHPGIIPMKYP